MQGDAAAPGVLSTSVPQGSPPSPAHGEQSPFLGRPTPNPNARPPPAAAWEASVPAEHGKRSRAEWPRNKAPFSGLLAAPGAQGPSASASNARCHPAPLWAQPQGHPSTAQHQQNAARCPQEELHPSPGHLPEPPGTAGHCHSSTRAGSFGHAKEVRAAWARSCSCGRALTIAAPEGVRGDQPQPQQPHRAVPAGGSARARPCSSPACAAAPSAALPIAACVIPASDGVGRGPISGGPEQSAHGPAASAARGGQAAAPRAAGRPRGRQPPAHPAHSTVQPEREVSSLLQSHLLAPEPAQPPPAPAAQPIPRHRGSGLLGWAQCCQGLDPRVTHPRYPTPVLQLSHHPRHCQTLLPGTSRLHGANDTAQISPPSPSASPHCR